jgi:hypothetical protein
MHTAGQSDEGNGAVAIGSAILLRCTAGYPAASPPPPAVSAPVCHWLAWPLCEISALTPTSHLTSPTHYVSDDVCFYCCLPVLYVRVCSSRCAVQPSGR